MDDISVPTRLTPEQIKTVGQLWRTTPTVGLPSGGFGKEPGTVEDLIAVTASMSEALKRAINERDLVIKEARDLEHEIEMGGRLLRRMLGTESPQYGVEL